MILCAQDPQREGEPAGQLRQEPVPVQDGVRVRQVQSNVSDEKKYFFYIYVCLQLKTFFCDSKSILIYTTQLKFKIAN